MVKRYAGIFITIIALCVATANSADMVKTMQKEKPAMQVTKITNEIYQVSGGVGNAFFYTGTQETVVIDATVGEETANLLIAEIKKISNQPIKHILLTHSDGDHVNGLATIERGQPIIAHPATRDEIAKANSSAKTPQPLPTITFNDHLTLYIDNARIEMYYFGPAHTSGDIVIHFPKDKVAIVGDLVFVGRDPLIHRHKQGSSFGLVKVLKQILKLDPVTLLSGHGEAVSQKEIQTLIAQLEEKQSAITALVAQNKTLDDVRKVYGIGSEAKRWPHIAEIIYAELTATNR